MYEDMLQLLINPFVYQAEVLARECLITARHPIALPEIIRSCKLGSPLIASMLIEESVNPDMPKMLRMNLFKIVQEIGFPLTNEALVKLREAMPTFEESEQQQATKMLSALP